MQGKDTLLSIRSNPKTARLLLTLVVLGLFVLAADPAAGAGVPSCDEVAGSPPYEVPYEEPICIK